MYMDTSYSEVEKQIYNQNVTIMPPNEMNFFCLLLLLYKDSP